MQKPQAPPNLWGSGDERRFVGLPHRVSVAAVSAAPASFASGGVLYAAHPKPRKHFFQPHDDFLTIRRQRRHSTGPRQMLKRLTF
ncbi:hypothetical protein [Azospirillum sp. BE72]|uniref:hypothetical protein n=1 Tax=Azospirillum sp. BE72 TaxID=2817776 RepID=UPI0028672EC3|nr:hypothetical protein [Azospirillum sp. BE72]MDR6775467.1 hypothetical protein [Azospirillum sp. BE72]